MIEIKNILNIIKKTFLTKGFLEFCLLGIINCFNDGLFSMIAHRLIFHRLGEDENVSTIIGYAFGLTIAFFLSCRFIFKARPNFKKYYRFILSYVPNFIIYYLVTFITLGAWNLPRFWGTFIAAIAGGPITFLIIKIYAFGRKID